MQVLFTAVQRGGEPELNVVWREITGRRQLE
ncbi:MAG: hypothetical protein ACI9MC_003777 [Kiritimatiellia bacterium]